MIPSPAFRSRIVEGAAPAASNRFRNQAVVEVPKRCGCSSGYRLVFEVFPCLLINSSQTLEDVRPRIPKS